VATDRIQAVKAAERKARSQMQEVPPPPPATPFLTAHDPAQIKVKATIQQIRKPMWFEKFHWFISTENYIVIAGRDAQQNEVLVYFSLFLSLSHSAICLP
jgi:predicted ribosome quality control (RQC) complex YloA/Tae2 family protein